jgi:hypothetical protein
VLAPKFFGDQQILDELAGHELDRTSFGHAVRLGHRTT